MYTLHDYFTAAGITDTPQWFSAIELRRPPWEHQIEDLKFIFRFERFGLFNDAGVGKTLPMQAALIYYACGCGNKGVVCMPPSLIGQFMESLFDPEEAYFKNLKEFVTIKALSGTKKKKDDMRRRWDVTNNWPEIVVMSYNAFSDMQPLKATKDTVVKGKFGDWVRKGVQPLRLHPLNKLGYNVLFFDESQALKNPSSGISKKVWKYVANTKGQYVLGLFTGSPIPNTLEDAYGTLKLLTPDVYPTMKAFQKQHCVYTVGNDGFKQLIGYSDREALYRNLYAQGRRVTKQEGLKDLPPMIPEAIPVEISPTHRHWYRKLMTERVLDLPDGFIDATQQQKLRQVAMQMVSMPERFIPKSVVNEVFIAFDTKVQSIDPHQNKIIMFSYYKETVKFLVEKYAHLNPAVINGASGNKDAARIKFREDDTCRVAIINWISGGAGLNFQVAPFILFYETPSVPSQAMQAIARSWRGGQDVPVNVTFFKVLGTIAAKSLKQLLRKDYDVNTVVRDKHKMLHELLGEYFD